MAVSPPISRVFDCISHFFLSLSLSPSSFYSSSPTTIMSTRETQIQKHQSCHEKYIIRKASYCQQGEYLALIRINPHHHEQIRNSILQPVRIFSLRIYQMTMPHASEVLSAIMTTNTVPWLTLSDLFDLLVTRNCIFCGNSFGGFISLPSLTRWCLSCVDTNPKLYEYLVRLFWPELRYSASIRKIFHGLNLAREWCVDCSGRESQSNN